MNNMTNSMFEKEYTFKITGESKFVSHTEEYLDNVMGELLEVMREINDGYKIELIIKKK